MMLVRVIVARRLHAKHPEISLKKCMRLVSLYSRFISTCVISGHGYSCKEVNILPEKNRGFMEYKQLRKYLKRNPVKV